ncbi:hypothetical protein C8T65DRAFT_584818, partial [Cerioporus squamosus]
FRDAVLSGLVKVDHKDNPNFLYPEGGFEAEDLYNGLTEGETLEKVVRAILCSPSSISQPPGQKTMGRGCISHIYKLDSISPRTIAYSATLWRNVLSSCSSWQDNDGAFSGPAFFKRIVKLFDGDDDDEKDWARETLSWWNAYIVLFHLCEWLDTDLHF